MKYSLRKRLFAITEIPSHFHKTIHEANPADKLYYATILPYLATIIFLIFTEEIK